MRVNSRTSSVSTFPLLSELRAELSTRHRDRSRRWERCELCHYCREHGGGRPKSTHPGESILLLMKFRNPRKWQLARRKPLDSEENDRIDLKPIRRMMPLRDGLLPLEIVSGPLGPESLNTLLYELPMSEARHC